MKKIITAVLSMILLANCGVSSKTVIDKEAIKQPYKNPLIVIPYEKGNVQKFCLKLKENIEGHFAKDSEKVEIILFEREKKELSLNTTSDIDDKINYTVRNDNKDLVIIFKPTNYTFSGSQLDAATYEIVAIDVKSKKEVWKCELTSNGAFGLTAIAEKSAKVFYDKLRGEGVL